MCILKHANPDFEKVVLEINYVLVILMQILVMKVYTKVFKEDGFRRRFIRGEVSQDNAL